MNATLTCCHGEEPHVVGWRFINERRAIDKNAACGWSQGKADVLYVADAFAVQKNSQAALYTRFRASQAFNELDNEIKKFDEFRQKDMGGVVGQ